MLLNHLSSSHSQVVLVLIKRPWPNTPQCCTAFLSKIFEKVISQLLVPYLYKRSISAWFCCGVKHHYCTPFSKLPMTFYENLTRSMSRFLFFLTNCCARHSWTGHSILTGIGVSGSRSLANAHIFDLALDLFVWGSYTPVVPWHTAFLKALLTVPSSFAPACDLSIFSCKSTNSAVIFMLMTQSCTFLDRSESSTAANRLTVVSLD